MAREGEKGIAAWVQWAIAEKKIIYLIVFAAAAAGIASLFYMNKDEYPTFEIKQGLVCGIYPGASASEIEEQLTKPLESFLFSYKEVVRTTTHSVTKDGVCYIYVDLNCTQQKKDEVWSKIKLGLQTLKMTLPTGVLAVAVLDDFAGTSSMLIAMESPDKGYPELQEYADALCGELHHIPDLAKASIVGAQSEEIAVTLDRDKLAAYGLSPASLMLQYQGMTLALPSGAFQTDYTHSPIHIHSGINSEQEVAERIIGSDPQAGVIRLGDVATIERRMKAPESLVSYNGNSCLIISVEMRPNNNIVAFGREVEEVLKAFSTTLPDSVTLTRVTDQAKVVKQSVYSFLRDLLISMLVVIIVMVMLFPIRSALIASSGVPVCTTVAIAVMYLAGIGLNTVTLAALIVCLGMIVDDSIITLDGYMDKIGRGYGKVEAAQASAKELFLPTFIATAAICLMFFPMTKIIDGYLGDFVRMFPWVITASLMMSLLYAVTVVPSLEVKYIKGNTAEDKKSAITRIQEHFFAFIQRVYEKCEGWCFRHPQLTLGGGVLAVILGLLMFSHINIQMMPSAARDFFVVELEVEGSHGVERTKQYADSLQQMLLADPRVQSVTAFMGSSAPRFAATYTPSLPGSGVAQLLVNTSSSKATEQLLREYESCHEHLFPEAVVRYKQMDYNGAEAAIVITLKGDDRGQLLEAADVLKRQMYAMDNELKWVHSSCDNYATSVDIHLDSDEAARLGISKASLALSLAGAFQGQTLATLWEEGQSLPVNLYSTSIGGAMPYETVGDQMIATTLPNVAVPLRQVATVEPGWALTRLDRRAGQEAVSIYADMRFGQSQPAAMRKLKQFIKTDVQPLLKDDVEIIYGGLSSTNEEIFPQIAWSFIAAVMVLFLFLLFHFKKASLAILTLSMSLLCLFGAFFGLWAFDMDFTMPAVLGLVSLVGIIVRNGILMYEYAEDERFKMGKDTKTSAMEAGKRRMRPIFLTSCTTALGVLPMILSGDLLWMPMGIVICFGTMLSIFLVVLVMPIAYWQLFRKAPVQAACDTPNDLLP